MSARTHGNTGSDVIVGLSVFSAASPVRGMALSVSDLLARTVKIQGKPYENLPPRVCLFVAQYRRAVVLIHIVLGILREICWQMMAKNAKIYIYEVEVYDTAAHGLRPVKLSWPDS